MAIACLGTAPATLLASTLGATVYGVIGGLIISGILPGDDDKLMFNFDKKL